jgi:hypothetical protein
LDHSAAYATVEVRLSPREDSTHGTVHTDLAIGGRAAATGQGTLGKAAAQVIERFAENLTDLLRGGPRAADAPALGEPGPVGPWVSRLGATGEQPPEPTAPEPAAPEPAAAEPVPENPWAATEPAPFEPEPAAHEVEPTPAEAAPENPWDTEPAPFEAESTPREPTREAPGLAETGPLWGEPAAEAPPPEPAPAEPTPAEPEPAELVGDPGAVDPADADTTVPPPPPPPPPHSQPGPLPVRSIARGGMAERLRDPKVLAMAGAAALVFVLRRRHR